MDRRFREMLPRQLEAEGAAFGIKMDSLKVRGAALFENGRLGLAIRR